jgi:hypothetical protein
LSESAQSVSDNSLITATASGGVCLLDIENGALSSTMAKPMHALMEQAAFEMQAGSRPERGAIDGPDEETPGAQRGLSVNARICQLGYWSIGSLADINEHLHFILAEKKLEVQ